MKNKHLVLLFLGVLSLGVVGRYLRWGQGDAIKGLLFKRPISELQRILLMSTDTLYITRVENEWILDKNGQVMPLPDSVIQPMLAQLSQLETIKFLETKRPDSLGLGANSSLSVVCESDEWPPQALFFGETVRQGDNTYTWVGLPSHSPVYLVRGDVAAALKLDLAKLMPVQKLQFDQHNWQQITMNWETDTCFLTQLDTSTQTWQRAYPVPIGKVQQPDVQSWLSTWSILAAQATPADFFDSRSAPETFCAELLFIGSENNVKYRFFYIQNPVLPDDPEKMRIFRHFKPQYVIESDLQPGLFFSMTDTAAVRRLKNL